MTPQSITQKELSRLIADLLASGVRVIAPARAGRLGALEYRSVADPEEVVLEGELPKKSLKDVFFPPSDVLFQYQLRRKDVDLRPVSEQHPRTVVIGARPCDAAAPSIVDRVMNWDYRDEAWNGRREATTIIALACAGGDENCFCAAVGLGPDAARGADILLVPGSKRLQVEVVTPKGSALVAEHASRFSDKPAGEEASRFREAARAKAARHLSLDLARLRSWLEQSFSHDYWSELARRCHGCGLCAAVCPTCHCFDIVDEPASLDSGVRRRNWDTCQTATFTVHGSGHNPRVDQHARFRQRVTHKYAIYPRKFQETLCTGCGRCTRLCPGGMDLSEILTDISTLAGDAQ